jgi:hypothetical protein
VLPVRGWWRLVFSGFFNASGMPRTTTRTQSRSPRVLTDLGPCHLCWWTVGGHSFAIAGETMSHLRRSRSYGSQRHRRCEATCLNQEGRGHAVGLYTRLLTRNHSPPHRQRSSYLRVGACRSPLLGGPNTPGRFPFLLLMPFSLRSGCSSFCLSRADSPEPVGGWL